MHGSLPAHTSCCNCSVFFTGGGWTHDSIAQWRAIMMIFQEFYMPHRLAASSCGQSVDRAFKLLATSHTYKTLSSFWKLITRRLMFYPHSVSKCLQLQLLVVDHRSVFTPKKCLNFEIDARHRTSSNCFESLRCHVTFRDGVRLTQLSGFRTCSAEDLKAIPNPHAPVYCEALAAVLTGPDVARNALVSPRSDHRNVAWQLTG